MFRKYDLMIAETIVDDLINNNVKDARSYSLTKSQKDAVRVIFEKDTRKLKREEHILNENWKIIKQKGVSANAK